MRSASSLPFSAPCSRICRYSGASSVKKHSRASWVICAKVSKSILIFMSIYIYLFIYLRARDCLMMVYVPLLINWISTKILSQLGLVSVSSYLRLNLHSLPLNGSSAILDFKLNLEIEDCKFCDSFTKPCRDSNTFSASVEVFSAIAAISEIFSLTSWDASV